MPFTPPKLEKRPYISVVPGRLPEQKIHKRISDAKNALLQQEKSGNRHNEYARYVYEEIDGIRTGRKRYSPRVCGGQIWEEQQNGEWKLLFDVPLGAFKHQIPWYKEEYKYYVED